VEGVFCDFRCAGLGVLARQRPIVSHGGHHLNDGSAGRLGIKPLLARTYPLSDIRRVQKDFMNKTVTSAVRGTYAEDQRTRQEAMSLITGQR
jgi:hypothetical protein